MDDCTGYLRDPTVKVKTNKQIIQLIETTNELKSIRKQVTQANSLELSDLKEIKNYLHKDVSGTLQGDALDAELAKVLESGDKFPELPKGQFLHEILDGAEITLPKNPLIDRKPELARRLERLKREQDEREYQQMTKGVSPGKMHKEDTIAFQLQVMNRQLIAVGQVVLSVAAGFAFGFFGMPLMVGGLEFGVRLLFGVLAAVIIAIAELYFLGKYLYADDEFLDNNVQKSFEPATKRPHQD